ncbi:TetR/AcrR family transcriptional regulator [Occultella kanbiaonis]|uniref:TetR/AcrR family transcriptional regulator n=1 Tax=Occultella kanbiaonis TaxID=2675754 RepID=UPI0013D2B395|nr:TetR-like C-terminal domain-containing protein [Occultella kanbiaonis]
MPRAGLSRRTLTETALAIIDDGGPRAFEDLTLAAVAARHGVSTPSLYKHVGSLADLRREVALESVRDLTRALGRACLGRAGADAVVSLAEGLRAFAEQNPARYLAAQHAGDPDEPADAPIVDAGGEAVAVLTGALRGYDFPPERAIDAVRVFRSAIHGFVLLELEGGFGLPRDLDASFDVLVTMLVRGLDELARDPG